MAGADVQRRRISSDGLDTRNGPWVKIVGAVLFLAVVAVSPAAVGESTAKQLYDWGQWERAEREAYLRDDAASMRLRSRFSLWRGDDEDARRFAQAAIEVAADDDQHRRSRLEAARLKWLFGHCDEAIDEIRQLLGDAPRDPKIRYELGRMLIDDGQRREGQTVLEAVARHYNDGHLQQVDELVWVGRAMTALERPRDANRAFGRALREQRDHIEANLGLGQLMLRWHNSEEAGEAFGRVLRRQADHPEALAAMARLRLQGGGRFSEATKLLDRAEEAYPRHPHVMRVRVRLLLATGKWAAGQQKALQFLERFAEDSEMLELSAAASLLRGDDQRFEKIRRRYDQRRSGRADLLVETAEFAALANRHRRAVQLYEEALERREDHRRALAGLGVALTRIGEEARGIVVLERAFDQDRFQLPIYNMLELYDRGLDDYVTDEVDGFRLRAHSRQFDLIRHSAEPVVNRARQVFSSRYGVELSSLTLEVFDDSESFAIRSVGLPHVDPHGICFGPVVLLRGPGEGDFNWPMVLWHELAHSYHLELSDERVPMWFTEGLAEYETRLRDGSWTRFGDVAIARRVQHGRLWSIGELDEAFLTGGADEINQVYQVAMLVMAYLDEEHGFDVIVEMLERFAATPETEAVFEAVLGASIEQTDAGFEAWLRRRYSALMEQTLVDWPRLQAMVDGEQSEHGDSAEAAAYSAVAAAMRGDGRRAEIQLSNLDRHDEVPAEAAVVLVMAHQAMGDSEKALEAGQKALESGGEGFDLRYLLSRIAEELGEHREAYVHAQAATTLAPYAVDGWRRLESAAEALGEEQTVKRAQVGRYRRDPHDAALAQKVSSFLSANGDYHGAWRAAMRWTQVAGTDARAHLEAAHTAVRLEKFDQARLGFDRAALASPGRRVEIWASAVEQLTAAGAADMADHYRRQIEDETGRQPADDR